VRSRTDYVIRKIIYAIVTIFAVVTMNFLLVHMVPGGAAGALTRSPRLTAQEHQQLIAQFGLDKPVFQQYVSYLKQLFLHGNLGLSYQDSQPVMPTLLNALKNTLPMVALGTIMAILIGTMGGVLSAARRKRFADWGSTDIALVFYSFPTQWLALMLIIIFGGILPAGGMVNEFANPTGWAFVGDSLKHMILPSLTLTLTLYAEFQLITRSAMLESLGEDYVLTARAKGLSRRRIIWRHGFRNASLPLITDIALVVAFIPAGAVLIEYVFSWPGIGKLEFDSLLNRDWPVALGSFFILTVTVIVLNLITDFLYFKLDPRITE
jgi:ABC-type dipeptide/oligopeptide/nickel transport system permease component